MSWIKKLFSGKTEVPPTTGRTPEEVVRFYQDIGFFAGEEPANVLKRWTDESGDLPDPRKPWDDVYLLRFSDGDVWAEDPEADVCDENRVYSEVIPQWARISRGAFAPTEISERWESEQGPINLTFKLAGKPAKVSPAYQDDWIDLEVLHQINALIAASGRQFECAVDGNFAVVVCITAEQKNGCRPREDFRLRGEARKRFNISVQATPGCVFCYFLRRREPQHFALSNLA